jgi:hypothetical protein
VNLQPYISFCIIRYAVQSRLGTATSTLSFNFEHIFSICMMKLRSCQGRPKRSDVSPGHRANRARNLKMLPHIGDEYVEHHVSACSVVELIVANEFLERFLAADARCGASSSCREYSWKDAWLPLLSHRSIHGLP